MANHIYYEHGIDKDLEIGDISTECMANPDVNKKEDDTNKRYGG